MSSYEGWTTGQLGQQRANLEGRLSELKSLTRRHPAHSPEWEKAHSEGKSVFNELQDVLKELSRR